jgi:diguanylate cyclase (GGDEF)-like protein
MAPTMPWRRLSRQPASSLLPDGLDLLTRLPNRATFTHLLQQALRPSDRGGQPLVRAELIFIDLDRFSHVNEALGQARGDALLQRLATRLRTACPRGATLARWGGDEFVMLAPLAPLAPSGSPLAERLLDVIGQPLNIAGLTLCCSASLGVTQGEGPGPDSAGADILLHQSGPGRDCADLWLARAEHAMRRAKQQGGGRCELAVAGVSSWNPGWSHDMLALETRLHHAVGVGGLALHYQPQVQPHSGRPVGLEALLRWRQPDGELWSPGQFLNVAERCGAMIEIGAWVIQEACAQMVRWQALGLTPLPVSVNISARQCLDPRLIDVVHDALASTGLAPDRLTLEVTESLALCDVDTAARLFTELRRLGVGISMDDFGAGCSSFAHLARLPLSQLKLDQSFVHRVEQDGQGGQGAAIVRATIELAHQLGMPVVAEGVESAGQLSFLVREQCDIAQGYYCARPLTPDATEDWLRAATFS